MANQLPIEETNLAGIGSDEDKAAREVAAKIDFHWNETVGSKPGIEIWRVENKRTENDKPDFGIAIWPKRQHGKFHRGDSYIILVTTKDPNGDMLLWDIHYWIGSESTQDEYGVAAYKVVELDELLDGDPMQHREIEGRESRGFLSCFSKGIMYLEGGFDSGFRHVSKEEDDIRRLYRVHRRAGEKGPPRILEVPFTSASLNDGDAFLVDASSKIYTWFGSSVSAFERSKSASVAHNIKENRLGHCECILDVGDDNEDFWELLGGKGDIKPAEDAAEESSESVLKKMYNISDSGGSVQIKEVPLSRKSLASASNDVLIVDAGDNVYVWIGKGATKNEKQQAIILSYRYLKAMDRDSSTCVSRVVEGQERRCKPFLEVF